MTTSVNDYLKNIFGEGDGIFGLSSHADWTLQVFIVVLLTLTAAFLINRFLQKIQTKFEKTKSPWDDALIKAIRKPLKVLVWIVGLTYAVDIIYTQTKTPIFSAIDPITDVAVISVVAWFVLRFIKQIEGNIVKQKERKGEEVDQTTIDAIGKLLRATVIITSALIVMQTLGFSISGVLAFGGVGGVAVGFAARDLLANFFGAIMVYMDRPFAVGDWVRSPDRNIEGTVENIGWRQTRIRTFDKRPLYIPNSVFSTIIVENPSRMTHRRIYETIGVRYDDVKLLPKIIEDVKDMLVQHDEIDENQTLIVNFNEFSASSVDFFVYTFTKTTNWIKFHEVKQDVLLKIEEIISKHKAEIAYPTTTMHIPESIKIAETA